ncbi:MAG: aminotransferase class V-fold PLP-dependent enzyme, partial [Planctomycetota bacterium]
MDDISRNWPTDLAGLRSLMPSEPGRINLNAGTLSPTPRPVFEHATRLREKLSCNGTQWFWRTSPGLIEQSRDDLAGFIEGDRDRLLLLPNVTVAMNLATISVPLATGDEVLTTDQCYGAMRLAMERRCRQVGATLKSIDLPLTPSNVGEIRDAVLGGIGPKTKAVLLDHVTSSTGLVLPVAQICAACRDRDIWTVIDGAHGPGMVATSMRDIGA